MVGTPNEWTMVNMDEFPHLVNYSKWLPKFDPKDLQSIDVLNNYGWYKLI